jgi:hypothetical protein
MSEDLLYHMADVACVRAWEDEGWGPYHKRLLTMCVKLDNPGRRKVAVTNKTRILAHLTRTGSISIREAMLDYGISGGSLSKYMSMLRLDGYPIVRHFHKHPITGQRYARYSLPKEARAA